MIHTQYSFLTTEELTNFALGRNTRNDLEVELAQRLQVADDAQETPVVQGAQGGSIGPGT